MKRLLIFGTLAGLLGLSAGSGRAIAQLPAPPLGDLPEAPPPAPRLPGENSIPVLPPAEAGDSDAPALPSPATPLPPEAVPINPPAIQPIQPSRPKIPEYYGSTVVPGVNTGPTAWQPGGYSARRGRPYYYTPPGRTRPLYSVHEISGTPWAFDHSAYRYHFGPGYYRHSEGGHYRFPYYTYRAAWYFPGHPIYNRDTNRPW